MELPASFGISKNLLITGIVVQACTCAVGYVGNIVTCVVIISNKTMRTTTNVYLFNLAVVDLIMLTTGLKYFTTRIWYMTKVIMFSILCWHRKYLFHFVCSIYLDKIVIILCKIHSVKIVNIH